MTYTLIGTAKLNDVDPQGPGSPTSVLASPRCRRPGCTNSSHGTGRLIACRPSPRLRPPPDAHALPAHLDYVEGTVAFPSPQVCKQRAQDRDRRPPLLGLGFAERAAVHYAPRSVSTHLPSVLGMKQSRTIQSDLLPVLSGTATGTR